MSEGTVASFGVTFVVDSARNIRESTAPELRVGETLAPSSWLGASSLDAIDAAVVAGRMQRRIGRDPARGTHWILHASIVADEPWLARVVAVDATPAVSADREAVFARLAHSLNNIAFAIDSVLHVIGIDRPIGLQLDECLDHLRDPVGRLSAIMTRLAACVASPQPVLARVAVESLVELALSRTVPIAERSNVDVASPGMFTSCDADALSDVIAAMLDGSGKDPTRRLRIDRVVVQGHPHARVFVDRRAAPAQEPDIAAAWDLHGGHRLDHQLRLGLGRAVVVAHGGDVFAESAAPGRVRLGLRLPLLTDG